MTHVIVAVSDDEDRAAALAEAVAGVDWDVARTEFTVLHVYSDNDEGASILQHQPANRVVGTLEEAGYDVDLEERSGEAAAEIVRYADDAGADVIAIGGRKRSPAGKAIFGSTSQDVMLAANCRVLFSPTDDS